MQSDKRTESALLQKVQDLESQIHRDKSKASKEQPSKTGLFPVEPNVVIASGAATVAWTSLSVADNVPDRVTHIYCSARLRTGVLGGTVTMTIDARQDASSSTRNILTNTNLVGTDTQTSGHAFIPVGPGASFEYQVTASAGAPASFDLTLEGYVL